MSSTLIIKCFLCNKNGDGGSSFSSDHFSQSQYSFMLFQILEIQCLENDVEKFEQINYCRPCMNKILNIRNKLEELERQEQEVLHEKHMVELQLKGTCSYYEGNPTRNTTEQFRIDILDELRSSSMHTMLTKIRKKKVGRKSSKYSNLRIMKNIEIPKLCIPENTTDYNSEILITPQNITISQLEEQLTNPQRHCPLIPINFPSSSFQQKSWPFSGNEIHINSLDEEEEVIEIPLNTKRRQNEALTSCSFDTDEIIHETTLNKVQNRPSEDIDPFEGVAPASVFTPQEHNIYPIGLTSSAELMTNISAHLTEIEIPFGVTEVDPSGIEILKGPTLKKNFTCGICEMSFHSYDRLKEHIKLHSTLQSNALRKTNLVSLDNQQYGHRNWRLWPCNRPKKCEECGRVLSSRSIWESHVVRIHRRQPNYQCPLCDYGCQLPSGLQYHMARNHGGERNFRCSLCTKTFKTNRGLSKHKKIHIQKSKQEFQCELCLTIFETQESLFDHGIEVHSNSVGHW